MPEKGNVRDRLYVGSRPRDDRYSTRVGSTKRGDGFEAALQPENFFGREDQAGDLVVDDRESGPARVSGIQNGLACVPTEDEERLVPESVFKIAVVGVRFVAIDARRFVVARGPCVVVGNREEWGCHRSCRKEYERFPAGPTCSRWPGITVGWYTLTKKCAVAKWFLWWEFRWTFPCGRSGHRLSMSYSASVIRWQKGGEGRDPVPVGRPSSPDTARRWW
jgi:hypothetical protein